MQLRSLTVIFLCGLVASFPCPSPAWGWGLIVDKLMLRCSTMSWLVYKARPGFPTANDRDLPIIKGYDDITVSFSQLGSSTLAPHMHPMHARTNSLIPMLCPKAWEWVYIGKCTHSKECVCSLKSRHNINILHTQYSDKKSIDMCTNTKN